LSAFSEKSKKWLFAVIGILTMCLGIVGIFVPLLPTTPFLLLSAYFFVKSSPYLYNFLINNKILGFYIKSYIEKKGIPLKLKIFNISLLWLVIGYSVFFVAKSILLKFILVLVALSVTLHIALLKTLKK